MRFPAVQKITFAEMRSSGVRSPCAAGVVFDGSGVICNLFDAAYLGHMFKSFDFRPAHFFIGEGGPALRIRRAGRSGVETPRSYQTVSSN
jgi:hypothetical protein